MRGRVVARGVLAAVLLLGTRAVADPFADEVVGYQIGTGGGAGLDEMPGIVLGPPRGGGAFQVHMPHAHLESVFGDDWFAVKAESFARFFGTPAFLVIQTVIVGVWMAVNVLGLTHFDIYPFILLNLAFSLQAAYAAPLILLAQTRQADRDKAHAEADAQHREDLARASFERQVLAEKQSAELMNLLEQNTRLTQLTQELTQRIKDLTDEIHSRLTVA
jgi:uncharacterized membrane protein